MLGIQEMVQKSEDQLKDVKHLLNAGYFHPAEASILGTLEHPQKLSVRLELEESLRNIPLREFLAKSASTKIGSAYLVPDKLHTDLMAATYQSDKVPLFAAQVVNGWKGGDLLVDIAVRQPVGGAKAEGGKWSLYPKKFSSGGAMPQQTVETVKATLSPISFSVPLHIGADLVEDAGIAPDIIQWHVTHAAQQLGQYATDLAIADLMAAADGDGTQCTVTTAGANTTTSGEVLEALREVGSEFWNPNTMIVTHEAWGDAITVTASHAGVVLLPPPQGYDAKFQMLDTILNNSSSLCTDVTSGKMTVCVTLVLDRSAALLCGRKRWLKIENYGNPVADLQCAVVSCRQDCVTLYKDASCEITETT